MKYTFGEVRKTVEASVTQVITIGAYILAEGSPIREILPPQWILVGGALLTIARVFRAPNADPPTPIEIAEKTKAAAEQAQTAAQDWVTQLETTLQDGRKRLDTAVSSATGVSAADVFDAINDAALSVLGKKP